MINSDRPSIYIGDSFYGKYDGFGILFECDTKCRCHMVSGLFKKGAIHNVKEDCHINHTDIPAVIERWISYIIRYIEKDSVKIEYLKKLSIDLIEKINK